MHAPRDCQGWGVPFPSKTKKNQAKYEIQTINKANRAFMAQREQYGQVEAKWSKPLGQPVDGCKIFCG